MYKLEIKLKQHTPLIHFQHDQEGATLRASEVKPKLDRFILTKLGENEENKKIVRSECNDVYRKVLERKRRDFSDLTDLDNYNYGLIYADNQGWIRAKEALEYKMLIKAFSKKNNIELLYNLPKTKFIKGKECTNYSTEKFPLLLSNMGGKEDEGQLVNFTLWENHELSILTFDDDLFNYIKNILPIFFANNNFGQRNSKGFGSFTIDSIYNEMTKKWELVEWEPKKYYKTKTQLMQFPLDYGKNEFEKQQLLFSTVDFYWKCLKSGINVSKRYIKDGKVKINEIAYVKAFIWEYLNNKELNWEKRKIKTHFSLETPYPNRIAITESNPAKFARALLGCPIKYEYRIPQGIIELDRKGKERECVESYVVDITHNEANNDCIIDRIASPIIFKPIIINDITTIYILVNDSIINKLKARRNLQFTFNCSTNTPINLYVDPDCIDHKELIIRYHTYFWGNTKVSNHIFKNVKIKENDRRFKMIPRDFNWNNILGKNKKGEDNYVSFFQII